MKNSDWSELLARLQKEFHALPEADRQWLKQRLDAIKRLQLSLDDLFERAGGLVSCADCDGECCGCGRHHLTLTNLLTYLFDNEIPPTPDFTKTCPYLGEAGCLLPVSSRPYNCITFFCERLEDRLDQKEQKQLRELDQQLRQEYLAVEEKYPVASLRGLWIALDKVGHGQILRSNQPDVLK